MRVQTMLKAGQSEPNQTTNQPSPATTSSSTNPTPANNNGVNVGGMIFGVGDLILQSTRK
ncbi:MAG: hypothetical protein K1Y36_20235 [Blastocatellia bacterium]|nr:hypothetical protein [Blastocatellia bacterium]